MDWYHSKNNTGNGLPKVGQSQSFANRYDATSEAQYARIQKQIVGTVARFRVSRTQCSVPLE
jgi:hypothetical protein